MAALYYIFDTVINIYLFVIIAMVIMSWLLSFGVVNLGNPLVESIWRTCNALTEPVMRPVRERMPNLGGVDLSPLVVIIGLNALSIFARQYIFAPLISRGL